MSAPAAIKATFSDFRLVKGRKVAQLVFETPIESADEALTILGGLPRPDREAWCAVCRIDLSKSNEKIEKQKRPFAELPIAQQAALLCNREAFWRFLCEREGHNFIQDETSAADALRSICRVSSRAELSTNARAAGVFQTLSHEFEDWLRETL